MTIKQVMCVILVSSFYNVCAQNSKQVKEIVNDQHSTIGVKEKKNTGHTLHPDAQWYPEAGLGLFLHWGISSVKAMNISWPMIPGRALAKQKLTAEERERIIREKDFNLTGKIEITPNEYFSMAKDFNPKDYNPEKWAKAAKDNGFKYIVLTTKHHEGFAMWPSNYGDFNTKTYMGGQDLLADYVNACRKYGLKIGFYYSGGDWWFEKDYKNFMYYKVPRVNPEFPALDADLNVRKKDTRTNADIERFHNEYRKLVRGQITELLTNYGKIDLLWFDGAPNIPNASATITMEEIKNLQPGIVVNPRFHGKGDFKTYERVLKINTVSKQWAEFCDTWNGYWPYVEAEYRSNGYVLADFVKCRALGINYLIGFGPMASGDFPSVAYKNMNVIGKWLKKNGKSIEGTKPLTTNEVCSVYATAKANVRYLYVSRKFNVEKDDGDFNKTNNNQWNVGKYDRDMLPAEDEIITLKGVSQPSSVRLLASNKKLEFEYINNEVIVKLPSNLRTKLVDVIEIVL
ncbi:MAG: alpha-L-fucosidase [Carboxylicivirga sp.]|jgi:alpha-L-fucosidase|nr:alpha-L-fucosidase [Carboxylicivirga sp.]